MADVPHFSFPFRFGAPYAAVTEQDSLDEIADCCMVILLCPQSFRVELPEFGIADPTFSVPVDLEALRATIERWESRATVVLDENPDLYDEAISRVTTFVQLRTEE